MFKKMMLAAVMATAASGAMAQLYMGAGLGYAKIADACNGSVGSCEDSSLGLKLYGGFHLNASVSAELGYLDFGQATNDAGPLHAELDASAVVINAAFRAPVGRDLTGVARIGLASVTMDEKYNFAPNSSKSTSQLYLGLGLEYALQKNLKATFSYDLTHGEDASGDSGNLHLFSAGLQYAF
ncbi:hypothetical protein JY96_12870 [Aquabacterium sp. NJ1]|uniref:outer membrane beta-barrel protein n=1 Tax=Aquabacterium sp. NJ1 TaxID=1538295 RepID=UPI00052B9253|nr:outer membrane beta-barrel protein [Aquabacterium sp. NJ1]KGM40641.1 hypothetical protein JY96_12870 [Aquabacterium sp. NJ1]